MGVDVIGIETQPRLDEVLAELDLVKELAPDTLCYVSFSLKDKNARGVLCAPITNQRCRELGLPHQVEENTSVLGTPFTVTVDKLDGCSTGVSADDRAATIRALADPDRKSVV